MAWYNANGEKAPDAVPVTDEKGRQGWRFNPATDPAWREANGYIYDHDPRPEPEPQPQTVFTKLKIRRAMRSLGIEAKLDALLAASATFAADWADAQEIDLADQVLVEALTAGSITPSEIEAIRELVERPEMRDAVVERLAGEAAEA